MAHRRLLTDEERHRFFGIPLDKDGMARCFTLSRADQNLVVRRRRDANRIGFAVQLALLRHPGIALAQSAACRATRSVAGREARTNFDHLRKQSGDQDVPGRDPILAPHGYRAGRVSLDGISWKIGGKLSQGLGKSDRCRYAGGGPAAALNCASPARSC